MTGYRLVAEPAVDADVEAVFGWYKNESRGRGSSSSASFAPRTGASWMDPSSIAISGPESGGGFRTSSTFPLRSLRSSSLLSCMRIAIRPHGRGGEAETATQVTGFAGR